MTEPAPPTDASADPEAALRAAVERPGIHVVHVWAPWCGDSLAELVPVWAGDVGADSVTFATVWSDGASGAGLLAAHGVTAAEVIVPGPKPDPPDRRTTLLGLPVSWVPTTWVFNRAGLLAFAFNYGTLTADRLADAVAGARPGV